MSEEIMSIVDLFTTKEADIVDYDANYLYNSTLSLALQMQDIIWSISKLLPFYTILALRIVRRHNRILIKKEDIFVLYGKTFADRILKSIYIQDEDYFVKLKPRIGPSFLPRVRNDIQRTGWRRGLVLLPCPKNICNIVYSRDEELIKACYNNSSVANKLLIQEGICEYLVPDSFYTDKLKILHIAVDCAKDGTLFVIDKETNELQRYSDEFLSKGGKPKNERDLFTCVKSRSIAELLLSKSKTDRVLAWKSEIREICMSNNLPYIVSFHMMISAVELDDIDLFKRCYVAPRDNSSLEQYLAPLIDYLNDRYSSKNTIVRNNTAEYALSLIDKEDKNIKKCLVNVLSGRRNIGARKYFCIPLQTDYAVLNAEQLLKRRFSAKLGVYLIDLDKYELFINHLRKMKSEKYKELKENRLLQDRFFSHAMMHERPNFITLFSFMYPNVNCERYYVDKNMREHVNTYKKEHPIKGTDIRPKKKKQEQIIAKNDTLDEEDTIQIDNSVEFDVFSEVHLGND